MSRVRYVAAGLLVALGLSCLQLSWGQSAPTPSVTVITVEELHCAGCGKRLVGKLKEVPGVGDAAAYLESKTARVIHKAGVHPSPRALWEAAEKAGQRPLLLQGPLGTFKAKPGM